MYRRKTSGIFRHLDFIALDIISIEVAFAIAYIIRHGWRGNRIVLPKLYSNIFIVYMMICIIVALMASPYKKIVTRGHYKEFLCTVRYVTIVTMMQVVYLYMSQQGQEYSRIVFMLTWAIGIIITYIVREIWKWVVSKSSIRDNSKTQAMVLITTCDEAEELIDNLSNYGKGKYHITGVCIVDKNMTGETIDDINVLASGNEISDYLCRSWVDEVFVSLNDKYESVEKKLVEDCLLMGITIHQNLAKIVSEPGKVRMVERMNEYTVLTSAINTASIVESFIKRLMDIAGGIIGLIFTGILFIFVAPAIYIKSPGPIFFKQWRVGKNGKKFHIYKFRSMYLDAEERKAELMAQNKVKDGMMFKMENDPRIIGGENGKGIGNFIRKTSIDEFPQFLNVLKGDMSLVGTRPPTLDEWEKYELHHRARLAIKPGLTGMWQVSGRSDITDFEEVVKLDTKYIMNWSLGKDIKILLKTVWVVLRKKGSS